MTMRHCHAGKLIRSCCLGITTNDKIDISPINAHTGASPFEWHFSFSFTSVAYRLTLFWLILQLNHFYYKGCHWSVNDEVTEGFERRWASSVSNYFIKSLTRGSGWIILSVVFNTKVNHPLKYCYLFTHTSYGFKNVRVHCWFPTC